MTRMAPVHPGKLLAAELQAREVTQAVFAAHIKVAAAYVNDIVKGRRGISAIMAMKIGKALGTGPELWMNLQAQYELNRLSPDDYDIDEIAA